MVSILFFGCSASHTNGDGAVADAPRDDCPPIGAPRCVDSTCCSEEAPAILQPGCSYVCPSGFVNDAICDPAASCGDFASPCARNADCTLAIDDCCGPCGLTTLDAVDPILASRAADHMRAVCPRPDDAICPGCASMDNPSLLALCREARCQELDVRQLPLSACTTDADCTLRTRDCCECGGGTGPSSLIAVRTDARGEYGTLVCDDLACPECEPVYPTDVEAYCETDGHCAVRPRG